MSRDYLVFTKTYGIIRKTEDNIKAARQWARALGPGEAIGVQPDHKTGTPVAELEAEWRAICARRYGAEVKR